MDDELNVDFDDATPCRLFLEGEGSDEAHRDLQRFIATVNDPDLADRLSRAIEGRGAFRRFRSVLEQHPDEYNGAGIASTLTPASDTHGAGSPPPATKPALHAETRSHNRARAICRRPNAAFAAWCHRTITRDTAPRTQRPRECIAAICARASGAQERPGSRRSAGRELYGQDSAAYALGRPAYPETVYDVLRDRCRLTDGTRVLEIGPGTGLATQRLRSLGAAVMSIEPNPNLATFLRRALPDTDLQVEVASLEDAQMPDGAFDLAVASKLVPLGRSARRPDRGCCATSASQADGLRSGGCCSRTPPSSTTSTERSRPCWAHRSRLSTPVPTALQIETEAQCAHLREAGFVDVRSQIIRSVHTLDGTAIRALYATMTIVLQRPEPERTPAARRARRTGRTRTSTTKSRERS